MSDHAGTSERRPLFAAIAAGDQAGVRAALDAGASAVAPNPQGDPPLLKAIVVGDLGIVRLLLAAGADPNQPGASGEPPLTLAARIDAPALQWLAQRGGTVKEDRFAPLLEALIQHGADLRAAGPEAARYGVLNACLPVLQTLDRLGLAWTEPDPGAGGPAPALAASLLALAVHQRTKVEIVRFLGQRPGSGVRGPGGGALVRCWAERPGDLDLQTLDALLAAGAAADLPDETGMTPLMLAAARGSAPACERLLAAGADDAARDREGRTALDHAAAAEDFSALAVLRGRGEGGEFQAGQAATFAIDQRIVCQPWGTLRSCEWRVPPTPWPRRWPLSRNVGPGRARGLGRFPSCASCTPTGPSARRIRGRSKQRLSSGSGISCSSRCWPRVLRAGETAGHRRSRRGNGWWSPRVSRAGPRPWRRAARHAAGAPWSKSRHCRSWRTGIRHLLTPGTAIDSPVERREEGEPCAPVNAKARRRRPGSEVPAAG